jgi:hypothetical protein
VQREGEREREREREREQHVGHGGVDSLKEVSVFLRHDRVDERSAVIRWPHVGYIR